MFTVYDQKVSFDNSSVLVPVGLPHEVLKRAALILDTLKNDNQIERLRRDNVIARDQQYKV